MKKMLIYGFIITILLFSATPVQAASQDIPEVEWQKFLGGLMSERASNIQQTVDGGYIIAGETNSIDGAFSGNHGGGDVWVVKLSTSGSVEWQTCLGGSKYEDANSIQQTKDGGYIVAGYTQSKDGDFLVDEGDSSDNGVYCDAWAAKLSTSGSVVWAKTFGGSAADIANDIQQRADGGYVFVGYTESNDGGDSGYHARMDMWIVALDEDGEIEKQKCLGGSANELAYSVQPTADKGYIVAGFTGSSDGDVKEMAGIVDAWVVKLDAELNIAWENTLGGTSDEYAESVLQTEDGGYILAGYTDSKDGDILVKDVDESGNHGKRDAWVVKLGVNGSMEWQNCLGGSSEDSVSDIQLTSDGGYMVSGTSSSTDGDVVGNHGGVDAWVVKLQADGKLEWQKCIGSVEYDFCYGGSLTKENGYIMVGESEYGAGDVPFELSYGNIWVVKLSGVEEVRESTGRPISMIVERSFGGQTLATFRDNCFGVFKAVELESGRVDYRALLKSDEMDLRLRIPFEDIMRKQGAGANNLLIEYRGQEIKIPMSLFYCESLLAEMPCQDDATIEIHLTVDEDGVVNQKIQLFVVEQIDEISRVVRRATVQ